MRRRGWPGGWGGGGLRGGGDRYGPGRGDGPFATIMALLFATDSIATPLLLFFFGQRSSSRSSRGGRRQGRSLQAVPRRLAGPSGADAAGGPQTSDGGTGQESTIALVVVRAAIAHTSLYRCVCFAIALLQDCTPSQIDLPGPMDVDGIRWQGRGRQIKSKKTSTSCAGHANTEDTQTRRCAAYPHSIGILYVATADSFARQISVLRLRVHRRGHVDVAGQSSLFIGSKKWTFCITISHIEELTALVAVPVV